MSPVRVCVVGSLMADLVMRVDRLPSPGETMAAREFGMFLGGKGFNQAVAAARLGAEVAIIGRVGDDPFGQPFHAKLRDEGIDASGLVVDPAAGTGIALPIVEDGGRNTIIIAPRANMQLAPADIEQHRGQIAQSDVLLLQLEVPPEASECAARIAREHGCLIIFDPAPVLTIPDALLRLVDIVTPNELEASALTDVTVADVDSAFAAASALLQRGPKTAIVTLGASGAVAVRDGRRLHAPGLVVDAVDTTAAGDAFSGALATGLAEQMSLEVALRFANAAGACAVRRLGAEPSLPRRAEVVALLKQ